MRDEFAVYKSCGDGNWPCCRGAKRTGWLDSAAGLILDGVPRRGLHILPRGLIRIRYCGVWSPARWSAYSRNCCCCLEAVDALLSEDALEFGPFDAEPEVGASEASCPECPRCVEPMIGQGVRVEPSWAAVTHAEQRPSWYRPVPGRRKLEPRRPSPLQSTSQ